MMFRKLRTCVFFLLALASLPSIILYIQISGQLDEVFEDIVQMKTYTNKAVIHKHIKAPKWQLAVQRGNHSKENFYLAEILKVRIYSQDKAKWTLAELIQWIHYMFYAGIEHIYLCDHHATDQEKLDTHLKQYIDLGLVTYISWGKIKFPRKAQVACYNHIIKQYPNKAEWHITLDMDEYPYISADTKEGFLTRYLKNLPENVAEVSMHNFIMMGQGDRRRDITIERINRRTPNAANKLDKPIYRPNLAKPGIHHTKIKKKFKRLEVNDEDLRMLHYWGARDQGWGPDTQEMINKTIVFNEMRDNMAPIVRESLIAFGETDSFSNCTGP